MNKRPAGLALAVTCAAFAAHAETEEQLVTLYGRIYATVESVQAKGELGTPTAGGACDAPTCAAPVPQRTRVADQSSYLGVRGFENVGGGVTAFFQLETQFKPDQNDTTFANRNSGVGLRGAFGTLTVGRWDTPFKWANGNVDPFDDLTIGALAMALQGSGVAGVNGQFDRRDQNVVQYWSPKFANLEVRLSYSANEARTATTNPRSEGASIVWRQGPAYVGYAYHELEDQTYGVYTNTAQVQPPVLATGSITVGKQTANSIFATIAAGPLKFGADYQEFKRDDPVLPATSTPTTVVGFEKQKAWLANVVWTVGRHQFIYQYMQTKGGGQRNLDSRTTPMSPKCDVNAVGYQHNFSRRTFILAQYVKVKNNETATCTMGQVTLALAAGQDPDGISLGLRHVF